MLLVLRRSNVAGQAKNRLMFRGLRQVNEPDVLSLVKIILHFLFVLVAESRDVVIGHSIATWRVVERLQSGAEVNEGRMSDD